MRFSFQKRSPGQVEFGIIYGGLALVALAAARFLPLVNMAPACTFKRLSGIACPTCGSTRSLVLLSRGEILNALLMNPIAALTILVALAVFFYSMTALAFGLPRFRVLLADREKKVLRSGAVALILVQWLYLILLLP